MSNNIYDILKKMQSLEQPTVALTEGKKVCKDCGKAKCECVNESKGSKPDYIDIDKDGDKKEPMKKAAKEKSKGAIAEAVAVVESALMEKYMGFKKTVAAIKKGGSAENPEAVAASIGRKKYGKETFQKAAAAGKKLGEDQFDENFSKDEVDAAVQDFVRGGGEVQKGKPSRGPRKPGMALASKHIGGGGDKMKASRTGRGANTQGKAVVAAENEMTPKQKKFAKLAPPPDKITYADKIAGAKKTNESGLAEGSADIGQQIVDLYNKIYSLGDDAVDHVYHNAPTFAKVWDNFEGDLDSIVQEVPEKILRKVYSELLPLAREEGLAEGWDDMQAYLNKKNKDSESKGGAGVKAGKRYGGAAQHDDDGDTETKAADAPKTRGRPKKDKFAR